MNERATASPLPASLIAVMLVGLPLAIVSESLHLGYYPKLLLLQAALVVLACCAFQRDSPIPRTPLLLPATLFLLVNVISITQAVNRVESIVTLSHRFALLAALLLIVSLIDRKRLTGLFQIVCATSAITSLIGIGQYAGYNFLSLPSSGMPSAFFGYRNFAASFTIATIPLVASEIFRTSHSARRYAWALALTLNATFLLATRARSAWGACLLSALACIAVLIWKHRASVNNLSFPKWKNVSLLILTSFIIAIGFSHFVQPKMLGSGYEAHSTEKTSLAGTITSTFEQGSDKNRFDMWGHTLEMIESAPILGVGIGNWQVVYPNFDRGDVSWQGATPRRPHNDYLWISAETGLIGIGLFIWLLIAAFQASRRAVGAGRDRTGFLQIVAAIGSLVAIGAHSLFSFPLERIPVTFVAVFSLAVLILRDPRTRWPHVRTPASRRLWAALILTQIIATTLLWRAVAFDRYASRQSHAVANQNWADGVDFGTRALSLGTLDPQVLLLRGLSYHMLGKFDQAIRDQERCLTYHPYLVNAVNNLGMSLNAAERYDEARQILNRIETLNPDHIERHLNLARSYSGLNQPRKAMWQLEFALMKAPRRTDIALELAGYHERQREFDRASDLVSKALRNEPEDFSLHYRLGVIRQKQGKLDLAATSFENVLQLNSDYAPVYYNIGELGIAKGDTAKAIRAYQLFMDKWTGAPDAVQAVRRRVESLR